MSKFFCYSSVGLGLLHLGLLTVAAVGSVATAAWAETFPDTQNHWANPFIEALAEKDIFAGYPDGTFKPDRPVNRDEFAAIVRQAFNESQERQIASGSVYKDIPEGYWASNAIKEAYEMGFMSGYPGGLFRPNQTVSRVEVLASLMRVLNLPTDSPTASTKDSTKPAQATTRPINQPRFFIPLGFTALIPPVIAAPKAERAATPKETSGTADKTERASAQTPASFALSNYYADADKIPQEAVNAVEQATKANIVVNHPNPQYFNPDRAATRGEVAAFIHQTLVRQQRIEPLAEDIEASNYIIDRAPEKNQEPQTGS
ncbi:S-layer homology domain-containing protein [Candidatus Gracilibacteria bacterium]|nr:S-layer homology domain-containing protein [Candidatus Gracilibacteria bacterium]NJM88724.1 S-layer homology domain-containing protein [Hydrococcus sp. RU_2_2]NJP22444.1 S-layer homology domain-containing protein [Hydrococcus sp. CRU_1_1]